jgi:ribosomal protein L39E
MVAGKRRQISSQFVAVQQRETIERTAYKRRQWRIGKID